MKSLIWAVSAMVFTGFAGNPDVYNGRTQTNTPTLTKFSEHRTAADILKTLDAQPYSASMLESMQAALDRQPENPELQLSVGFGLLSQALVSDIKNFSKAAQHFQKAAERFPNDPVLMIYWGLATGAQALDMEPSILSRIKWAREGFKKMDQAVKLDPDNYLFRLFRGDAELKAHPVFRRGDLMESDARFLEDFMRKPAFETLLPHQKARLHLFMANYLAKKKQPKEKINAELAMAVQLGRGTSVAAEAQARLEGRWADLGFES
jgi:hypothetical protein